MAIKLLKDYRGSELETITEEQVKRLIELECADCGAPMLPPHPGDFQPFKPEHDVTLYSMGGTGIMVKTAEEASKIAHFLEGFTLYTTEYAGYRYYEKIAKPMDPISQDAIGTQKYYSTEQFHKFKDSINDNAEKKSEHEKRLKEYNDAESSRRTVSERIWGVVHNAWNFKHRRDSLLAELSKYQELADGDESIGFRFFAKAKPGYGEYLDAEIINDSLHVQEKTFENPEAA